MLCLSRRGLSSRASVVSRRPTSGSLPQSPSLFVEPLEVLSAEAALQRCAPARFGLHGFWPRSWPFGLQLPELSRPEVLVMILPEWKLCEHDPASS
jgi:hypothetical protein